MKYIDKFNESSDPIEKVNKPKLTWKDLLDDRANIDWIRVNPNSIASCSDEYVNDTDISNGISEKNEQTRIVYGNVTLLIVYSYLIVIKNGECLAVISAYAGVEKYKMVKIQLFNNTLVIEDHRSVLLYDLEIYNYRYIHTKPGSIQDGQVSPSQDLKSILIIN